MRVWNLTAGDIRFQWKHGFYAVYLIFTAVYLMTLLAVPARIRPTLATVFIFTDPAAMGLFFMGAIVLMEKNLRVHCALAVSPAHAWEYSAAKLLSLSFIGLIVAAILALFGGIPNLLSCLIGVAVSSLLFSGCGLLAAMRCKSLNQFVLLAVPFELFICLPPALLLFGVDHPALTLHPGVAAVRLIYGDAPAPGLCILTLLVWCVPVFLLCVQAVKRYFIKAGGASA